MKSTRKIKNIYMDYASGVLPNPSGIHTEGLKAKNKLENTRRKIANILNARRAEIIFTSGGTESNNLAIQGAIWDAKTKSLPHIITTNIEHASVLETFKILKARGQAQITIVPVETNGLVDPKKIRKALRLNTVLVSVMYVNNEIGTIQPIREIAKEIRHYKKEHKINIFFHTDAVQAVNYLDLNVERLGVDMLTLSGAKLEDAGRVGVLYKKSYVPLVPILGGGDQEFGLRPGTENLLAIVSFGEALELAQKNKGKESVRVKKLRNYFLDELFHSNVGADFRMIINGDLENRLANNVNITIPNIPGDLLVIELSGRGIMASAKSACKMGDNKASHVIKAIRPEVKETDLSRRSSAKEDGSLRFSLGRTTMKKDIDYTIKTLYKILTKLKKWYN